MAKKLHESEHGKTTIADLILLTSGEGLGIHRIFLILVETGVLVINEINNSNAEEQGHPKGTWDDLESLQPVRDISKLKARGDFTREAIDLGHNVAEHAQHGNTTVLDFAVLVAGKLRSIPVAANSEGIKESCCCVEMYTFAQNKKGSKMMSSR